LREKPLGGFLIEGYPSAISGHGLILGTDKQGKNASTRLWKELVEMHVRFGDTIGHTLISLPGGPLVEANILEQWAWPF